MEKELPEPTEVVVVKITKVLEYGAFGELPEYSNQKGFIHISQVTSGWVKNIRNFVKENQLRAAQVLAIDRTKNQIDLSLTKVSSGVQRSKIEEFNRLVRAKKLIEVLAKTRKVSFDDAWEKTAEPLLHEFDSLPEAFNEISLSGKVSSSVAEPWNSELLKLVSKNVSIPKKSVKGVLELTCFEPDGVEVIKNALEKAEKIAGSGSEIIYLGSGKYKIAVTSPDFKSAEKKLKDSSEEAMKIVLKSKGKAEFKKLEKE
ncbi:MAG: S1 RNA-binding domain-containing protein [archaeon]